MFLCVTFVYLHVCVRICLGPGPGPGPGAWVRKYIFKSWAHNGIEKGGFLCRQEGSCVRLDKARGEQTCTPKVQEKHLPTQSPTAYEHVPSVAPYCVISSLFRVLDWSLDVYLKLQVVQNRRILKNQNCEPDGIKKYITTRPNNSNATYCVVHNLLDHVLTYIVHHEIVFQLSS